MLCENIPVAIDGEIQYLNFSVIGDESRQIYKIWSGDYEMHLNTKFDFIGGDFPIDWLVPAVTKLKQIVSYAKANDLLKALLLN